MQLKKVETSLNFPAYSKLYDLLHFYNSIELYRKLYLLPLYYITLYNLFYLFERAIYLF